jgi:NADH:ubiquinone oxidoreductase subunit C
MIAFKDLKEILEITIRWENKLKDFYDVAEFAMKSEESKKVIRLLRERLVEKLGILSGVDLAGFGKTEWVRYAPAYREEELIPVGEMHRNATPQEIFTHLLDYEDKLKKTYAGIAANLISRSQKELFESLVQFKEEQSEEVRRLMESYGSGS